MIPSEHVHGAATLTHHQRASACSAHTFFGKQGAAGAFSCCRPATHKRCLPGQAHQARKCQEICKFLHACIFACMPVVGPVCNLNIRPKMPGPKNIGLYPLSGMRLHALLHVYRPEEKARRTWVKTEVVGHLRLHVPDLKAPHGRHAGAAILVHVKEAGDDPGSVLFKTSPPVESVQISRLCRAAAAAIL